MGRKNTIRTAKFPYHITSRSNHREWFDLSMDQVWKIALKSLIIAHEKHPINLHAFVLMSNHYHLVIDTPNADIDKFMYELNKNFSLELRIATRKVNRMFGGRYKASLITNNFHYYHVLKYVFLNPNKARIVTEASQYPYSTLHIQIDQRFFPLVIKPSINVVDENFLQWLKESHNQDQVSAIGRGLKRSEFRFSGSRKIRKPPVFEERNFMTNQLNN